MRFCPRDLAVRRSKVIDYFFLLCTLFTQLLAPKKPQISGPKRKRSPTSYPSTSRFLTSSKRQKTNEVFPYTKHPVHWALDGNVIVKIKTTGFKLHRSTLARASDWFRRSFKKHGAPEEGKVLDIGETCVSVKDFETLLDAIEDAMCVILTCHHG